MGGVLVFWLLAAFSVKRGRVAWSRELRIRAVIAVIAIVLIRLGAFRDRPQRRSMAGWSRARPVRRRVGIRDLGPRAHRAQLGHPDDAEGRTGAGD